VNDAPKAALTTFVAAVASREGAWADALASTVSASPGLDEVVAAARYRHGEALARLGIGFDSDASENDLRRRGAVEETLQALRQSGYADEQSGALWLRASALGDDQDRVLVRTDGPTYLAGDLAYHRDKFNRGFTRLIDLWDADHRSYIARTHAGLKALGCPDDALQVLVCGTVRCLKDGTEVRGGRYGGFVSLEEVLDECAPADLRWRLIRVAPDEPLDLPLGDESLVERLRTARDRASSKADPGAALPEPLGPESAALLSHLLEWPARVLEAAENLHPHVLALWAETLETHIAAHDLPPRLAAAAAGTLSRTFQLLGIA
jgi:arginyl-tRNA synthetase